MPDSPPGERPPLHRPRPAPDRELLRHADPHRVVEHRHDQAGADARQGPVRRLPPPVRLRHEDRPRLPERGGRRPPRARATTTAPRWARSRSARASRSRPCRCSRPTTCSPTTASTCRPSSCSRRSTAPACATRVEAGETRRVVSEATAEQMREMLVNVVAEGTGTRGGITGYSVAGKTGTARKPLPEGGYGAAGQLPLRRQLRRLRAGREARAVDHRRDRRAGRRHLRRHRRRPGVRRPGPVRPAPLPHPAAPRRAARPRPTRPPRTPQAAGDRGGARARAGAGHARRDHDHDAPVDPAPRPPRRATTAAEAVRLDALLADDARRAA